MTDPKDTPMESTPSGSPRSAEAPRTFHLDAGKRSRVEATFHSALERPLEERTSFIAGALRDEDSLQELVMRLLAAYERAGDMLDDPLTPEIDAELNRLRPEKPGDLIGAYRLVRQIGEGGFGVVWLAEQERPVRREVALKIIKLGMDTKEVIARFEQERQALALMDHPNIAKVYDAGATQYGRPYFVMELVRGSRITDYCNANCLTLPERLNRFVQVCQAVQHAHQKGIIHRDLKPSNIMVTEQDGIPVPKVIDFGVAKAIQQRLTDLTVFTQVEQMIGTPPYMSPEQTGSDNNDIDTRSDIYALGVILYELVTGRTPLDAERLSKADYEEVRRAIREQETMKPSAALSALPEEALGRISQQRRSIPKKLVQSTRGDIDWISLKALEKDRTRRYDSASAFALDVQRYLRCEAVSAGPPNFSYRAGKLIRKYKEPIARATVLLVLLTSLAVAIRMCLQWKADLEEAIERSDLAGRLLAESQENSLKSTSRISITTEVLNPLAAAELALLFSDPGSGPTDGKKAIEQFQAAADRGSSAAALTLGRCLLRGNGIARDVARGIELIKRASNAGYPEAVGILAVCYYEGEGVERDLSEAFRLFSRASELGHQHSLGNLAIMHLNGEGTERKLPKAVELVEQGANAGIPHCMYLLARFFQFGLGVKADAVAAREWHVKAANAGSEASQEWIRKALRIAPDKSLTRMPLR
jgi:serine/threonine protein kinase